MNSASPPHKLEVIELAPNEAKSTPQIDSKPASAVPRRPNFKNNNSKQRRARMSKQQIEVYIRFLEENPNFTHNINNISYDLGKREQDFNRLVHFLNNTTGAVKDKKLWQETLADWRSKLTKRYRYYYSEEARGSITAEQIRQMKRFDELDVRALKALGKWEDQNVLSRQMKLYAKRKRRRDEDEPSEGEAYENFGHGVSIKSELEVGDSTITETSMAPLRLPESLPDTWDANEEFNEGWRQSEDSQEWQTGEERANDFESAMAENTRAIKQHTAAILAMTDSINALTSTLRTYMCNK